MLNTASKTVLFALVTSLGVANAQAPESLEDVLNRTENSRQACLDRVGKTEKVREHYRAVLKKVDQQIDEASKRKAIAPDQVDFDLVKSEVMAVLSKSMKFYGGQVKFEGARQTFETLAPPRELLEVFAGRIVAKLKNRNLFVSDDSEKPDYLIFSEMKDAFAPIKIFSYEGVTKVPITNGSHAFDLQNDFIRMIAPEGDRGLLAKEMMDNQVLSIVPGDLSELDRIAARYFPKAYLAALDREHSYAKTTVLTSDLCERSENAVFTAIPQERGLSKKIREQGAANAEELNQMNEYKKLYDQHWDQVDRLPRLEENDHR